MRLLESIRNKARRCWPGALVLVMAGAVGAAPQLTIRADTVVVNRFDSTGLLNIYLKSTVDTVVGVQFWLQLNRPDIALFEEAFDTSGTLLSGWDLVHVHSIGGMGTDVRVVGLANDLTVPGSGAPILPSEEERLLVRISFRVLAIPDTMTDRTAAVLINGVPSELSFSRPNGTTIGITLAERADTTCLHCMYWIGNDCQQWQLASGPPCDTIIVTLDTIPIIDTLTLTTVPGSISICNRTVWDLDINDDGIVGTVRDLVDLMRYVAGDTNAVGNPIDADVNGDCRIDWGDAILLDSFFNHIIIPEFWPPLPCPCSNPVRVCCWQMRGNLDSDMNNMVDLTDLSTLVAYLTGFGPITIKCSDEANVDGLGIIDLSDLSTLVAYLTGVGGPPAPCP